MVDQKPGAKTTEFWLSLASTIAGPAIALLVLGGILSPDLDQAAFLQDAEAKVREVVGSIEMAVEGVVAIVSLFVGARAAGKYAEQRTALKQQVVHTAAMKEVEQARMSIAGMNNPPQEIKTT